MKPIRVATSPLTNTIFAGHISRAGLWAENKQDVTMDCLISVAEHIKNFGSPVEITDGEGKMLYRLSVELGVQ